MPEPRERQSIKVQAEKTVLAAVRLPESRYEERDPFGELRELARQAGAVVVGEIEQRRDRPESGTYMGTGKIEELKDMCSALDAKTIIFDHDLSPKQIAKIEQMTERKVLDRSELILDIFASRATTHEAKLQVEIAQLEYTYPRLRAMWSHLERIVGSGGIGGVGTRGPGEQQLEIDRRLVQRRKTQLKRELEEIQARKRRAVEKRNNDYFTVGLVGYTNAGKSTLFNALTDGGAYADDRVFATLMTRTREWDLGGGHMVMLSDTVGFVRDLPHHLVASFRATLEEATHADLLLVLLDVSDPSAELHYETVMNTLEELFDDVEQLEVKRAEQAKRDGAGDITRYERPELLVLLNKADKDEVDEQDLLYWQSRAVGAIPLCALRGDPEREERPLGQDELIEKVKAISIGEIQELDITVPLSDSKTIHTIENRTEIVDRTYDEKAVTLRTKIGKNQLAKLRSAGARMWVMHTNGEPYFKDDEKRGWVYDPTAVNIDF
ncbi:MAG: GTPase HflX [Phycisphaerae bacterium]|nr:GTPase HflX [Phycisphaerae bacterium]MBM91911.1 GTPase HflX [Phycisphaerae bacterium]